MAETSRVGNALGAVAVACMLLACERHLSAATEHDVAAHAPPPSEAPPARAPLPAPPPQARAPDLSSDGTLTSRITAAILSDPGMAGADVSVNADHGVVSLTGNVKSQEQIAIASALAQHEDGVMRIDNHLALNTQ